MEPPGQLFWAIATAIAFELAAVALLSGGWELMLVKRSLRHLSQVNALTSKIDLGLTGLANLTNQLGLLEDCPSLQHDPWIVSYSEPTLSESEGEAGATRLGNNVNLTGSACRNTIAHSLQCGNEGCA